MCLLLWPFLWSPSLVYTRKISKSLKFGFIFFTWTNANGINSGSKYKSMHRPRIVPPAWWILQKSSPWIASNCCNKINLFMVLTPAPRSLRHPRRPVWFLGIYWHHRERNSVPKKSYKKTYYCEHVSSRDLYFTANLSHSPAISKLFLIFPRSSVSV